MRCGNGNSCRRFLWIQVLLLVAGLVFHRAEITCAASSNGTDLFGSTSLRGNLKILTRWQEIMRRGTAEFTFFATCTPGSKGCPAASDGWRKLAHSLRGQSAKTRARKVNAFFNRWPYVIDQENYNMPDYWATPLEFIRQSGDCEEYAITKFFALQRVGIRGSAMRIVILKDTIRNITHAVLTVRIGEKAYVLDNMSDLLLPDTLYTHYRAQFSFNEQTLRLHLYPHAPHAQ